MRKIPSVRFPMTFCCMIAVHAQGVCSHCHFRATLCHRTTEYSRETDLVARRLTSVKQLGEPFSFTSSKKKAVVGPDMEWAVFLLFGKQLPEVPL